MKNQFLSINQEAILGKSPTDVPPTIENRWSLLVFSGFYFKLLKYSIILLSYAANTLYE